MSIRNARLKVNLTRVFTIICIIPLLSSCSVSLPFTKSQDCLKINELLATPAGAKIALVQLDKPADIKKLARVEATKIADDIQRIYPNLKYLDTSRDYVYQASLDDISKDLLTFWFQESNPELFSQTEKNNWNFLDDVQKYEVMERVESYLFGEGDIGKGPCGPNTGIAAANDIWDRYTESLEVLYFYRQCQIDQDCFAPLTKLQEICQSFEAAVKNKETLESEITNLPYERGSIVFNKAKAGIESRIAEKFLSVEDMLKQTNLNEKDQNALSEKYGYGKFSKADLALGINKYAYGFDPDNRFYHFSAVCKYYAQ